MANHCPMCGEKWDGERCGVCGWHEGKQPRYTAPPKKRTPRKANGHVWTREPRA